ncbi:OmpP1/FadL family transporter [Benzoatithermus flavus]|uniref:Outer membrane protein transport protein n=1 Tax=Benzoatithermus flavus TaxID=3108223 RepID=A0ABU8XXP5_9PROT
MRRLGIGSVAGSLLTLALGIGGAEAAGFALKEQSTTAQGNAFAGATSAAEDVSYMFFNPAALGWVAKIEAATMATLVAPRSKLESAEGRTVPGTAIPGRGHADDIADNAVVPAFYAAAPLPGGVRIGLGINAPFGLETGYPDQWVGRYHAVHSRLTTVNINPAVAWRPRDWVAFGAGFQAQHADGELTNAVDFGTIGAAARIPGAAPGRQDGFARLTGDDWAYGWDAGAIVEPVAGTRFGIAYRSEIQHTLDGDVDFSGDTTGIAGIIRRATGAFADTDASLKLNTPASLSFGVHQDVTDRLAVMAEAQWTDWSVFDQLTVKFDNPAQPDNVTEEEWRDSWFFALGATWRPDDRWTLRAGIAFDQSPVRDRSRTPRIPDENRYWLSLGAGWQPLPWLGLDAAFTYILVEDSEVDLAATDTGSAFRGDLHASYDNDIILAGLSARVRF